MGCARARPPPTARRACVWPANRRIMEKILVIEDDRALRQLVLRALRDQGYTASGAENGIEGTQLARRELPDLILCDVRMDKLDGYGTLAALRQEPTTSAIPVILMTGQADQAGMRQGMELGADDYLPKPFTVSQLIAAVQARLKKQVILRQQVDKRLASLRANISWALPHELRTPLNGIMGFSEMIVTDHASLRPDDVVAMAKAINESARRLHRMIENTLLYAQLELAAGDEARIQALRQGCTPDLARLVAQTAEKRAESAGRQADLQLALQPGGVAMAEPHSTRIVEELLDNALKFSAAGSAIQVATRVAAPSIILSVTDAGRGMRPEHVAEIGAYMQFERRFYEQQGSGLGLTIAKRLTEVHGGSLTIRSELGVGTEITLALPGLPPAAPTDTVPTQSA